VRADIRDRFDRPHVYTILFVGLMVAAVSYPDGFELLTLGATVVVLLGWAILLLFAPDHDGR
jgi:hypothetical protein